MKIEENNYLLQVTLRVSLFEQGVYLTGKFSKLACFISSTYNPHQKEPFESFLSPAKGFIIFQGIYYKLRRMTPCAVGNIQFRLALPEPDELQISIVGKVKFICFNLLCSDLLLIHSF